MATRFFSFLTLNLEAPLDAHALLLCGAHHYAGSYSDVQKESVIFKERILGHNHL